MASPLVVFDLGGVLVRIRHTWDDVLNALSEAPHGRPNPWRQAEYEPLTRYQEGDLDQDAYLLTLGGDLGITPEAARKAHAAILEGDYVGARQLVSELNAAGVQTACLSNTNALHWVTLTDAQRHPAIVELGARIPSFEIKFNKPRPEAFMAVESRFPDASRKFFFDDSIDNVLAARHMGWEAHRVDPDGDPPRLMRGILVEAGILNG